MAKAKSAPRKKRGGQKVSSKTQAPELNSLDYWRELADLICPDVTDPIEKGEITMFLRATAQQAGIHWKDFSKITEKTDDKTGTMGFSWKLDRRTTPSEIAVVCSYTEKHGGTVKARVPDPNVMELDFNETRLPENEEEPEVKEEGKGPEQLGLNSGD